ncbi:MAG: hypothetical protein AAB263_19690 [Planctomycetota bacterium]
MYRTTLLTGQLGLVVVGCLFGTAGLTAAEGGGGGSSSRGPKIVSMSVTGKPVKNDYTLNHCYTDVPLTKDTVYDKSNAPPLPKLEELQLVDAVTFPEPGHELAITWHFTEKVRVGRFINGDIYVVGPVTVKEITPAQQMGDEVPTSERVLKENFPNFTMKYGQIEDMGEVKRQVIRNGSVLNKPMSSGAGWDSRIPQARFMPKEISKPPYAMKPGDCLMSVKSIPIDEFVLLNNHQPTTRVGAVLTCVKEPLPADAFRPSFHQRNHKIYLARNLKRELLYNLPKPASAPNDAGVVRMIRQIQLPWIGVTSDWGWCNPSENGPMYGQNMTNICANSAVMLQLDYSAKLKEPLLINFVQYGIDLYGAVEAGYQNWFGHGGYGSGRKLPIVMAGIMLGESDMLALDTKYPKARFGEMMQVWYGKHYLGHTTIFASHPLQYPESPELYGPAAYFDKYCKEKKDNQRAISSGQGYRHCCTTIEWVGEAVAMRLMRAEKPWGHPAFFDYIERWMKEDTKQWMDYADFLKEHGDTVFERERTMTRKPFEKKVSEPYFKEMYDQYWNNLPKALQGQEAYAK